MSRCPLRLQSSLYVVQQGCCTNSKDSNTLILKQDIYPIERRSFAMGVVLVCSAPKSCDSPNPYTSLCNQSARLVCISTNETQSTTHNLLGGPIAGGFIAQRLGWRWVRNVPQFHLLNLHFTKLSMCKANAFSWCQTYWILIIASGVVTTLITLFMFESYAPAILEKKTKRLRKGLGREDLRSKLTLQITKGQLIRRSLIRPIKVRFLRSVIAAMD